MKISKIFSLSIFGAWIISIGTAHGGTGFSLTADVLSDYIHSETGIHVKREAAYGLKLCASGERFYACASTIRGFGSSPADENGDEDKIVLGYQRQMSTSLALDVRLEHLSWDIVQQVPGLPIVLRENAGFLAIVSDLTWSGWKHVRPGVTLAYFHPKDEEILDGGGSIKPCVQLWEHLDVCVGLDVSAEVLYESVKFTKSMSVGNFVLTGHVGHQFGEGELAADTPFFGLEILFWF